MLGIHAKLNNNEMKAGKRQNQTPIKMLVKNEEALSKIWSVSNVLFEEYSRIQKKHRTDAVLGP